MLCEEKKRLGSSPFDRRSIYGRVFVYIKCRRRAVVYVNPLLMVAFRLSSAGFFKVLCNRKLLESFLNPKKFQYRVCHSAGVPLDRKWKK